MAFELFRFRDAKKKAEATTEIVSSENFQENKPAAVAAMDTSGIRKYESPPEVRNPQEEVLVSRDKTSSKKIGRGVTDSSFVELKDDGSGIFKTEDHFNERAAYLIDRFLGFNLVPPTVIRQVDGEIGSVQEFIPDARAVDELGVQSQQNFERNCRDDLMKMWVFDMIIHNQDRHPGNFLVKDKRVYAIDHGRSLDFDQSSFEKISFWEGCRQFFGRPLPNDVTKCFKSFLEKQTEQKILEDLLAELYNREKASIILKRIKYFAELVTTKGEIRSGIESIQIDAL